MASTAIVKDQTLSEQIQTLNEQMEELAVSGEWQQISEILPRRNAMLLELEHAEQTSAFMAARRSTERIGEMANMAQLKIAKKITKLARGKKATDSYRSHT